MSSVLALFVIIMARKKQNLDSKPMPALQSLRETAGLTQEGLAKLIPDKTGTKTLTRQAISNWERGLDEPELTIAQVKALCRALGKSLDELPECFGLPKRTGTSPPGE